MIKLGAIWYPEEDVNGNKIPFDNLFLPYIWKEIYFEGLYLDVFNQKEPKSMTILDVGSQIGLTVKYFQPYAKKLYAIEPSTESFEALKKNKEFNNWDNVEVFKMALADKDGEAKLRLFRDNRTCHSIDIPTNPGEDFESVRTQTFETFFKENTIEQIDFCKFDVEGEEDKILRSPTFRAVAEKIKAIEVEFHYPSYPELVKIMIEMGYTARRYDSSAIVILFTRS